MVMKEYKTMNKNNAKKIWHNWYAVKVTNIYIEERKGKSEEEFNIL